MQQLTPTVDAHTFLVGFFRDCPRDQFIELFYIEPGTGRVASEFVQVGNWSLLKMALVRAEDWNRKGYGVFFGVCPRTHDLTTPNKTARGSEADVDTIGGFWTELDSVKEGRDPQADLLSLQSSDTPPSLCVLSGGGVHAHWRLDKPHQMSAEERQAIKSALKGIGKAFNGDPSVAEFARILRVPGFANTKPGRDNAIVETVLPAERHRYALPDLLKFKPAEEPRRTIPFKRPTNQTEQDTADLAKRALDALSSSRRDDYNEWLQIGLSLTELGATGLSLWDYWSSGSANYESGICEKKWRTFKKSGRTIGYLFRLANDDNPSWRPLPELPRYAEQMQILEAVKITDDQYPSTLPIDNRAAINIAAPPSAGPLLELIIEARALEFLTGDLPFCFEDLKCAAEMTGRDTSIHTIRAGLKAATDPHGVEFLRILSHYKYNTTGEDQDTDQSRKNLKNPCNKGGRPGVYYELLPWSEIVTNIARASVEPIIRKVFPLDKPLVAPIRADFLAALGCDNIDTVADDLEARYGEQITSQPGYRKAINRANVEFKALSLALANPRFAPIPAGWKYHNASEYQSCCLRAVMVAQGGAMQRTRKEQCAMVGCSDRNLPTVQKGAGVKVDKYQFADGEALPLDALKNILKYPWNDTLKGQAVSFLSSSAKRAKSIEDPDVLSWTEGQFEIGASVRVRYHLANRQTIDMNAGQPVKEKPIEVAPEPATEQDDEPELLPDMPAVEVAPEPVKSKPVKSPRVAYAEAWQKKLVNKFTSWEMGEDQALDRSTGEIAPATIQLGFDALLHREPTMDQNDDPLLDADWLASIGATATVIYHEPPDELAVAA